MSGILKEVKQWMRIDFDEDDDTIDKLILTSSAVIEKSTGVKAEAIENEEKASALYVTLQKMIITNMYENRNGAVSNNNPMIVQLSTLLSTYNHD